MYLHNFKIVFFSVAPLIDIIPRTADNDRNYTLRQGDDINFECSATEFARIVVTHIDTNGNTRIVADTGTY